MKATQHCMTPLAQRFTAAGLLRFAAPSIGMMLVISLYSVTDGIFIGRYAGASALAASNIVYPAINLLYGLAIMLASGGSALVAKTLGEGQPLLARQRFTWITVATFTIGAVFALFLWAFFSPVLAFLGASPEMLPDCRAYLGVLLPFFPIAAVSILFDTFCIADGRAGLGFLVAVASGVTNAALDYLFLAHMDLGILGAGLATGLADLLAATLGFVFFLRFSRTLRFTRFTAELSVLASAASNGISEMVTQCSVGITTFLFNLITFAWAGEDGVAAICVILYAEMLLTSFLVGFSNGVAPVFSYHYGAKHDGELLHLLKCALTILAIAGEHLRLCLGASARRAARRAVPATGRQRCRADGDGLPPVFAELPALRLQPLCLWLLHRPLRRPHLGALLVRAKSRGHRHLPLGAAALPRPHGRLARRPGRRPHGCPVFIILPAQCSEKHGLPLPAEIPESLPQVPRGVNLKRLSLWESWHAKRD